MTPPTYRRWALCLGVMGVVSVVLSWPVALFRPDQVYTRQFDLYPILWLMQHARDLGLSLFSAQTWWPAGESLLRLDSFILFALAWLAQGLVEPATLVALITLIGPVLSGLAAERCAARGFGIPFPYSMLAGIVYALNGLTVTAFLEGHLYFLLNPFLPMFVWALEDALRPGAQLKAGLRAGGWWLASLLVSAYIGVAATLILLVRVGVAWGARADRRALLSPLGALLGFMLLSGIPYTIVFLVGSGARATPLFRGDGAGNAMLLTLASYVPDMDLHPAHHSIGAPLGFGMLGLILVAPVVLRRYAGWRWLFASSLLAPLVALGPVIQVGMESRLTWPGPLNALGPLQFFAFFHFPIRLMWLYYLLGGLLAAKVASVLAERVSPRRVLWLLPLLFLDGLVTTGAPFRAQPVSLNCPPAYFAAPAQRPVLDVFAEGVISGDQNAMLFGKVAVLYQTRHQRPILDSAFDTHGVSPRLRMSRLLLAWCLDAWDAMARGVEVDPQPMLTAMEGLGLGAVAVHVNTFPAAERVRFLEVLGQLLGAPTAISHEGGESLVLFTLPEAGAGPADQDQARAFWQALRQEGLPAPGGLGARIIP